MLCPKIGWNMLDGSAEEDSQKLSIKFYYFQIRIGVALQVNPLHPGILCAKFGWNWPSGSGEEDENVKSLQADRQTDRRRTTGYQNSSRAFSSGELKTIIAVINFQGREIKRGEIPLKVKWNCQKKKICNKMQCSYFCVKR